MIKFFKIVIIINILVIITDKGLNISIKFGLITFLYNICYKNEYVTYIGRSEGMAN
jgi:hypothetical protein